MMNHQAVRLVVHGDAHSLATVSRVIDDAQSINFVHHSGIDPILLREHPAEVVLARDPLICLSRRGLTFKREGMGACP